MPLDSFRLPYQAVEPAWRGLDARSHRGGRRRAPSQSHKAAAQHAASGEPAAGSGGRRKVCCPHAIAHSEAIIRVHRGLARGGAAAAAPGCCAGYFVVEIFLYQREFRRRLAGAGAISSGAEAPVATNAALAGCRRGRGLRGRAPRHGQRDRQLVRSSDVVASFGLFSCGFGARILFRSNGDLRSNGLSWRGSEGSRTPIQVRRPAEAA